MLWKHIQYVDKLYYLLDRAILLKLSLKFGLRRVVVDASNKKRLERISMDVGVAGQVP